ncbi:hypothetical protein Pan216_21170 [Planctomycetes bacterium Pan216]|uniref:Uncharacterized protein n=1 Tax=Kolteria novifilia TaxID=2527975 RepID=A0A518B2P9_9BACT|nr:hypothetical protein Pan216_21170 [Planctomycetes bacterium Pan216]
MKCLSIQQPWAWAILAKGKNVENRTRPPIKSCYRGPLLIHASLSRPRRNDALLKKTYGIQSPNTLPAGCVVGVVDVVDSMSLGDLFYERPAFLYWAEGPWCLLLQNPRALAEPIPWKGRLGSFDVPLTIEELEFAT